MMDNSDNAVACPVCTLYMREGITLRTHLETHPKDQVIEALVRIAAEPTKNGETPADIPQTGTSHFTTAVTYQQFLSSNGLPNYVSVPTVPMMYSPYVIQQQQQQLQLVSTVSTGPHPPGLSQPYGRQMLPLQPSPIYPLSQELSDSLVASSCGIPSQPENQPEEPHVSPATSPTLQTENAVHGTSESVSDKEVVDLTSIAHAKVEGADVEEVPSRCDLEVQVEEREVAEEQEKRVSPSLRVRTDLSDTDASLQETAAIVEEITPAEEENELNLDSTGPVKIIEIDGIHILVPTHLLGNSAAHGDSSSTIPFHCVQQATDGDVDDESLNIQTDEMMPPRGELSEQESIGGNDSSMWAQVRVASGMLYGPTNGLHNDSEDVSTSYDLLARESWEASDGSDIDADVEEVPEPPRVTSPHVETPADVRRKKLRNSKTYICWTCGDTFNCPKERRVHQSGHDASAPVSGHPSNSSNSSSSPLHPASPPPPAPAASPLPQTQAKEEPVKKEEKEGEEQTDEKKAVPAIESVFVNNSNPAKMEAEGVEEMVTLATVDTRVMINGEGGGLHTCHKCRNLFPTMRSLQVHLRTVHHLSRDERHSCITCKEMFPTDSALQAHFRVHPLECIRCGKYFYRRQNLDLHMKRHLGIKPFKCGVCDKAFVTKQKLVEHTNSHTGNAPLKCSLCDESFRRYSNLIQHKNRYHLKVKKKVKDFVCKCGEVFHSKKKLRWHSEIHDEKPKSCNFCNERFVHESSLTRHVRKAHDKMYTSRSATGRSSENVECHVCGSVFLKTSLQAHVRTHSGERPFPCHICGKEFTTKWNLQSHRWTHAARSSKPFKCSLCKSAFFRRADYTAHMHSHRNVRPYTCNHCGCQFIRKYNCIRHMREHESDKTFVCSYCNKTFHRSYYLKDHMRVHSGARPFACHICGKASSTKSNHNKHVKIHHAREPVNTEN